LDRDREFGEFVDARALVMRRTAYLLCGDWHRAEDIVQTALTKLYVAWSRVRRDSVDAYARKVLVRTAIDESRRGFFQRERSVDAVPERAVSDHAADYDLREALDALPPGQRAVVVLRYWEDLSITETARLLGRTEGTVKSQASKGLAALRDLLVDEPVSKIQTADVIRAGRTRLARRRTAIAGAMAFVVLVGLGTVGYLAMPMQTKGADVSGAAPASNDRNAELTAVLRRGDVLPAGVTAQDPPGRKALEFSGTGDDRRASALLKDAQGTSVLRISLLRIPGDQVAACSPPEVAPCEIREVNGNKVRIAIIGKQDGPHAFDVQAYRTDGMHIAVMVVNVGEFLSSQSGEPHWGTPMTRSTPVLDQEALIKIATLPGLTF